MKPRRALIFELLEKYTSEQRHVARDLTTYDNRIKPIGGYVENT